MRAAGAMTALLKAELEEALSAVSAASLPAASTSSPIAAAADCGAEAAAVLQETAGNSSAEAPKQPDASTDQLSEMDAILAAMESAGAL
jgi:hypothetical protein